MSGALIHSMTEFSDLILGCLDAAGARDLVEIGAEFGGMSHLLAGYAAERQGTLTSIDPAPRPEFLEWAGLHANVRHLALPSLEALPTLANIDAWVIDGDHNYYTVLHELERIDAIGQRDGKPLLAFLHDVSWPTARRDMYYAPERIPFEFRHPHGYDAGVTLDSDSSVPDRGFRGAGQFAFALQAGGARNGVLTAVEDFLEAARNGARPLAWASVPAVFGLGVVFDATAPWAESVAALVHPFHENALLATMERNRLRNYLALIEWQDRERDAAITVAA